MNCELTAHKATENSKRAVKAMDKTKAQAGKQEAREQGPNQRGNWRCALKYKAHKIKTQTSMGPQKKLGLHHADAKAERPGHPRRHSLKTIDSSELCWGSCMKRETERALTESQTLNIG